MCEEHALENTQVPTPNSTNHTEIAVWSCEACPFFGFEYWDKEDTKAIDKYLGRKP